MSSRPKISDKTIQKVEKWIEEHPEKGITATNKAIEYLVEQGLQKSSGLTDEQRQAVEQLIKKHSE